MTQPQIKVLIVDDSAVSRMLLTHLLGTDPRIRVIGAVADGHGALEFVQREKPDVVLMDIHMPGLDGFETTRRIMESHPLPIVICSGKSNPAEVATSFRLLEAGAVACVEKPVSEDHPEFGTLSRALLQTIRLMSEVKVVRRWPRARLASESGVPVMPRRLPNASPTLIGIGASTGGPPALQTVLAGLPKDFLVPLLIVQHISPGFLPGLVEWLNNTTALNVHIAAHGVCPQPGHAYLAPDDFHLGVNAAGCMVLSREAPESGLRPAVGHLFRSLARHCGADSMGVLLTGMGKDGAAELKLMREQGAQTIAQDFESSVVHGMPGEAIAIGGAAHVVPVDKVAGLLLTLIKHRETLKGVRS